MMSLLPPFHFTVVGWVAIFLGAFAIGLNKGGLTGLGILPVLVFAVVFSARESTGRVLPLLVIGDICAIITYRRVVLWDVFWRLLPPALFGVVVGFLLLGQIPNEVFAPLIGWLIAALIALQLVRGWMGEKLDRMFESRSYGMFMGVLAGITTMLANAAGPVSTLYFLSVRLPKWNLIGTSSFLFFMINLVKVPFSAYLGLTDLASLKLSLMLLPMVAIGFFCGRHLTGLIPQKIFDRFLLTCTAIGAIKLIFFPTPPQAHPLPSPDTHALDLRGAGK